IIVMKKNLLLVLMILCSFVGVLRAQERTITGLITSLENGTAIPGAKILLYTGQRPMGYATADSTGAYTFVNVPDGLYGLRVTPPTGYRGYDEVGGADSSVRDQIILNPADKLSFAFSFLKTGQGAITARVLDANGSGISGIRVILFSSKGSVADNTTDANGTFVFPSVPFGNYGVFAERSIAYRDSAENPLPAVDGFIVDEGSTDTASFKFALCAGSLNVRVRDDTGSPVPGTLLTFYGDLGVQDSILGADAMRNISRLACGHYGVRIRPPVGWTADEGRGTTFQDNLSVHRGTALDVQLNVKKIGRGTVRVRVMDNIGLPVANIRTVLYTGQGLVRDVVTDDNGFATMSDLLVNAEYGVRIVPRAGYNSPEGPGTTFLDGISLVNGQTRDVVFTIRRD
ncbi:MAG: carboxypeptidase-like regulatory domain-containing protein, partial [Gemmatimonadaceae bacterium]